MVRGETGGEEVEDSQCGELECGRGTSTGCFMCKEISRLVFDRLVIRYRGTAHRRNSKKRGETKDGLDSISGGSAWKHLEGEEQTLMSSDKATQRGLFSSGSRHLPLKLQL